MEPLAVPPPPISVAMILAFWLATSEGLLPASEVGAYCDPRLSASLISTFVALGLAWVKAPAMALSPVSVACRGYLDISSAAVLFIASIGTSLALASSVRYIMVVNKTAKIYF